MRMSLANCANNRYYFKFIWVTPARNRTQTGSWRLLLDQPWKSWRGNVGSQKKRGKEGERGGEVSGGRARGQAGPRDWEGEEGEAGEEDQRPEADLNH